MNIFKKSGKHLTAIFLAVTLAGCSATGGGLKKEDVGTVLGGIAGGLLGSEIGDGNTGATIAGTLAGAWIGNEIGKSLDRADAAYLAQQTGSTLERRRSGQAVPWRNPDTGNYGTVTPNKPYQNNAGQWCREFTQTAQIDGKTEKVFGTACRQANGTWKIQP